MRAWHAPCRAASVCDDRSCPYDSSCGCHSRVYKRARGRKPAPVARQSFANWRRAACSTTKSERFNTTNPCVDRQATTKTGAPNCFLQLVQRRALNRDTRPLHNYYRLAHHLPTCSNLEALLTKHKHGRIGTDSRNPRHTNTYQTLPAAPPTWRSLNQCKHAGQHHYLRLQNWQRNPCNTPCRHHNGNRGLHCDTGNATTTATLTTVVDCALWVAFTWLGVFRGWLCVMWF